MCSAYNMCLYARVGEARGGSRLIAISLFFTLEGTFDSAENSW